MPKLKKFTDRNVRDAKADSTKYQRLHAYPTTGLYLVITPKGVKRWVWRYTDLDGKPNEMGLGIWPYVSLERARQLADHLRGIRADNRDPQELKERNKLEGLTLRQVSEEWLEKRSFKSESWLRDKRNLLFNHCESIMDLLPMQFAGKPEKIDKALAPIRKDRPGQAERLRATLVQIFNYAKVKRIFAGENPADREVQHELSPLAPRNGKHWKALPYQKVPAFMRDLRTHRVGSIAAWALDFVILTACRTNEVLGARWEEFDFNERVWTIPVERLKTKNNKDVEPHRVPLSKQALALLDLWRSHRNGSPLVFPGRSLQEPLDEKALRSLLYDMGYRGKATVHGFRSAFRTWAEEQHNFDYKAKETCLGHMIKSPYDRTDVLEKRRPIMEAWADYCCSGSPAGVSTPVYIEHKTT
jgi:integrase